MSKSSEGQIPVLGRFSIWHWRIHTSVQLSLLCLLSLVFCDGVTSSVHYLSLLHATLLHVLPSRECFLTHSKIPNSSGYSFRIQEQLAAEHCTVRVQWHYTSYLSRGSFWDERGKLLQWWL